MKKPSKTNLKLEKFKLVTGGGVVVNFIVDQVLGAETYQSTETVKSTKEPHQDLVNLLKEMDAFVASVFGFSSVVAVMDKPEFKADVLQKDYLRKYVDEMISRIAVTGISISGKDDNLGIVITAKFRCGNNQVVALNTHKISLKSTKYGFEERLETLMHKIKDEVYEFLFEDKVANPTFFDQEGDDDLPFGEEEETDNVVDFKRAAAGDK